MPRRPIFLLANSCCNLGKNYELKITNYVSPAEALAQVGIMNYELRITNYASPAEALAQVGITNEAQIKAEPWTSVHYKKRPKKSTNEGKKKSVGVGFSSPKQKLWMKGVLLEDQL